jgi:hypothetical protein
VGREALERGLDLGGLFLDEDEGLGRALVAAKEAGGNGDVDGGGAGLTPEAELLQTLLVADEIDGDAGEPGAYGAVPAEAGAAVVGLEEAVLGDGLGEKVTKRSRRGLCVRTRASMSSSSDPVCSAAWIFAMDPSRASCISLETCGLSFQITYRMGLGG